MAKQFASAKYDGERPFFRHPAQVQGVQLAVSKRSGFGFAFGNGLIEAGKHFEHALAGGVIGEGETFPAFVFDPVDFDDDRSVTGGFRSLWSFCRGSLHASILLGFQANLAKPF